MKITLDIDQLLSDGRITQGEYDRLRSLALPGSTTVALTVVIAIGLLTVAGGLMALIATPWTALGLGLPMMAAGIALRQPRHHAWQLLGSILLVLGSLCAVGGWLWLRQGDASSQAIASVVVAAMAVLADSGLLAAASVCLLAGALGAWTDYGAGEYELDIEHPLLTVVVFAPLAAILLVLARVIRPRQQRLARIAGGMAVVVANFGLWVASLWGDHRDGFACAPGIAAILWGLAALATLVIGMRRGDRWLINAGAVFGVINLYSQWFERLELSPLSVMGAGILLVVIAGSLLGLNRRRWLAQESPAPHAPAPSDPPPAS